ncbi:MAG: lysophospholipid acyltransferase family protein, partial [Thermoguttaceae bacterium]
MSQRSLPSRIWYRLLQRFLQLLAIVVYRVRFSGRENIPTSGGVLVVSNHQSHLDPPLVGIGVPRRMNYLARKTLFRFKPFGWLLHSVDAIPIDRDGFGLGGIKESLKRLKHDEMVVV